MKYLVKRNFWRGRVHHLIGEIYEGGSSDAKELLEHGLIADPVAIAEAEAKAAKAAHIAAIEAEKAAEAKMLEAEAQAKDKGEDVAVASEGLPVSEPVQEKKKKRKG